MISFSTTNLTNILLTKALGNVCIPPQRYSSSHTHSDSRKINTTITKSRIYVIYQYSWEHAVLSGIQKAFYTSVVKSILTTFNKCGTAAVLWQ